MTENRILAFVVLTCSVVIGMLGALAIQDAPRYASRDWVAYTLGCVALTWALAGTAAAAWMWKG